MSVNKPNKAIVHCSASDDTKGHVHFSAADLKAYHHDELGWLPPFGYHYYIDRKGKVTPGRPEDMHGAHTLGQNEQSIGVCYEGSFLPTIAQMMAFKRIYEDLQERYGFDPDDWHPHNQFANKDCPGFDMADFRDFLRS